MGKRRTYVLWTTQEVQWLRENHRRYTCRDIQPLLPRHTRHSILWKARQLKLPLKPIHRTSCRYRTWKKWSEADLEYLRREGPGRTVKELAREMGRTYHSVMRKTEELGLRVKLERPGWSQTEKFKLLQWIEKHSSQEVARRLGRPHEGVREMMRRLKVYSYQGTYSLTRACAETGYDYWQLLRAKKALDMNWSRRPHSWTTRYVISHEQLEELCEWLKQDSTPREAARQKSA